VGLALADPLGVAVRPLPPLGAEVGPRGIARAVGLLALENEVGEIVIGLPRNMNGSEGPAAAGARKLHELISAQVPAADVLLWDERLTTVMAEKTLLAADLSRRRRRELIDSQAAAVLVVDYLRAKTRRMAGDQGGRPPVEDG
jgi:putative Holliday junction resolvase